MNVIDLISRYIHVSTAVWLAGGAVFIRFVLKPAMGVGADPAFDDSRATLGEAVRSKWVKFVAAGTLLLLVSGFWNYLMVSLPKHKGDGPYHALMGVKMLLALVAFFLSAALAGRSPKLAKLRDNWRMTGGLLVVLLATIVFIGSYLKMRGVPVPPEVPVENSAVS